MKAAVLSVDLLGHPVFQFHQQLIVTLPPQVVDAFQTKPVFPVYVTEAALSQRKITRDVTERLQKILHIVFNVVACGV